MYNSGRHSVVYQDIIPNEQMDECEWRNHAGTKTMGLALILEATQVGEDGTYY